MSEEAKTTMSEELALEEVKRWAELNDIDISGAGVGADGKQEFDAIVPRLVRAVQQGRLAVNDDGDFEYTVSARSPEGFAGETITLTAPNGAAYMALDKFKDEQGVHRTLALASAMTGKDIAWFGRLHNSDYKIVVYIVSFFIAG